MTTTQLDAILHDLASIRKGMVTSLAPFITDYGFKVIPNSNISCPVIMLPPADYDTLNNHLAAAPEFQTSDAAQPGDAGVTPSSASVPGTQSHIPALTPGVHSLYSGFDPDAPKAILDRNGEVCPAACRVCGLAEAELDDTPVCPGPSHKLNRCD